VIVFDNASTDGTVEAIGASFATVRLIWSPVNIGFACGTNRAIAASRSPLILLLNPDAFLTDPNLLSCVTRWLEAHPDFAGVGCQLVLAHGGHQVGDAGYAPTPMSIIVHAFALMRILPFCKGVFVNRLPRSSDAFLDVDWISGAFFLVRRTVIADVGPMDESFFMYGEDLEWGCRMRRSGYRLAYLPWLKVLHLQGGTQAAGNTDCKPSAAWLVGLTSLYSRNYPQKLWVLRNSFRWGYYLRALVYYLIAKMTGERRLLKKAYAMRVFADEAAKVS
jgi:GT2 family glycosyltransferase